MLVSRVPQKYVQCVSKSYKKNAAGAENSNQNLVLWAKFSHGHDLEALDPA